MPQPTLRRQFVIFALKFTGLFSLCLGLLPFKYNGAKLTLENCRVSLTYSICFNVGLAAGLVVLMHSATPYMHMEYLGQRSLNSLLRAVNLYLSILTVLAVMYRNWSKRRHMLSAFVKLVDLRMKYFKPRYPIVNMCAPFEKFVLWRFLVNLLHIWSIIFRFYLLHRRTPEHNFMLLACLCILALNVLFLSQNHFCFIVLYIYRYLWVLNRQLETIALEIRLHHTTDYQVSKERYSYLANEVDEMLRTRKRLLQISTELMGLYSCELLMVIALFITSNVVNLFYLFVYFNGKVMGMDCLSLLLFLQIMFIRILDFWMMDECCELALKAANKTAHVLREFNEFPNLDARLAESFNALCYYCGYYKLHFSIYGIFNLKHQTGAELLITSVMYSIYLIQFDFMQF